MMTTVMALRGFSEWESGQEIKSIRQGGRGGRA
jgi:hypothetical protein